MGYSSIRIDRKIDMFYGNASDGGRVLAKLEIGNVLIPLSKDQLHELEKAVVGYNHNEKNFYYCYNCNHAYIGDIEDRDLTCIKDINHPCRKDLFDYCEEYEKHEPR